MGGITYNEYDSATGNLIRTTDPLGNETEFGYTGQGLPELIRDALDRETRLGWEGGLIQEITDAMGNATRFVHDARGRISELSMPEVKKQNLNTI